MFRVLLASSGRHEKNDDDNSKCIQKLNKKYSIKSIKKISIWKNMYVLTYINTETHSKNNFKQQQQQQTINIKKNINITSYQSIPINTNKQTNKHTPSSTLPEHSSNTLLIRPWYLLLMLLPFMSLSLTHTGKVDTHVNGKRGKGEERRGKKQRVRMAWWYLYSMPERRYEQKFIVMFTRLQERVETNRV